MKKNVVALLLSVVLASGSLGGAPAMAAETVEQQTGEAQEETEEAATESGTVQAEDAAGAVEQTDTEELGAVEETSEATDENDAVEAEDTWESAVTKAETAEESKVDDIEGAGAPNENDTAEQEIIEESPAVETDNESSVSVEETETGDIGSGEEPQAEAEISGIGATQDNAAIVEPAKAGIATEGEVEDVSADLKVAADAEKLKGGKWQEVTKTVHHEDGHYVTVQTGTKTVTDREAWDEPVYVTICRCTKCGATFTDVEDMCDHLDDAHDGDASYSVHEVEVDTIHHPAETHEEPIYGKQWVDEPWDEQVKTGKYQYIVNGKPVKNKLAAIGNETYYFDADGIAATGWREVNGSRMYFGSDRKMKTGWLSLSGKKYYLDDNGKAQTGWQTVEGSTYYFNKSDGAMHTKWLQVDGKKYYLDTDGTVHTGWLQSGDKWFYFRVNGEMHTGMLKKDGVYYYLEKDGTRHSDWLQTGGQMYYFKLNGQMLTGWLQKNGKKFYFKTTGQMHTGWLKLNGKYYYFRENGQMVTGRYKIGNKWLTFSSNGVRQ